MQKKLSFDFLKQISPPIEARPALQVIDGGISQPDYHIPEELTSELILIGEQLRPRYEKAGRMPQLPVRLGMISWWFYYVALCLECREESEFDLFSGLLEDSRCRSSLENINLVIRKMAGLGVENRDKFLAKLRKVAQAKLETLPAAACYENNCGCHMPAALQ